MLTGARAMLIVSCTPAPGFDFYRCGWREEEQDGRTVRIGLCWPAGVTTLPDDSLTAEQLDALRNDPGKRIKVRHVQEQPPAESVRHVQEQPPAESVRHVQEQPPAETALGANADAAAPCPVAKEGSSTLPPTPSGASTPERAAPHRPSSRPRRAMVTRIERRDAACRNAAGSASPWHAKQPARAAPRSGSGPPPKRAALAAPLP